MSLEPFYADKWRTIYYGDCRELLPLISGLISGVSAVVTDPPYELNFMGKSWDSQGVSFQQGTWGVIRRVCLPGAPLLSFGGSRTQHRIACAIEDAGWELRDCLMWVTGQGFPKSLDVSKAIDAKLGAKREVVGSKVGLPGYSLKHQGAGGVLAGRADGSLDNSEGECAITVPSTPEARLWDGWGTALKPSYEPILLCMNPLDGTFANNALKHGVAGLNIDGCRVAYLEGDNALENGLKRGESPRAGIRGGGFHTGTDWGVKKRVVPSGMTAKGRFPANFIHDGSQEVLDLFPQSKGQQGDVSGNEPSSPIRNVYGEYGRVPSGKRGDGNGSAARFFYNTGSDDTKTKNNTVLGEVDYPSRVIYCAKASRSERESGLEDLPDRLYARSGGARGAEARGASEYLQNHIGLNRISVVKNDHPTLKPLALMEYLCKLVKMPAYNLVLDPFCGSGTTLLACGNLGIHSIGIDSDEHSCEIAAQRCAANAVEKMRKGEY